MFSSQNIIRSNQLILLATGYNACCNCVTPMLHFDVCIAPAAIVDLCLDAFLQSMYSNQYSFPQFVIVVTAKR